MLGKIAEVSSHCTSTILPLLYTKVCSSHILKAPSCNPGQWEFATVFVNAFYAKCFSCFHIVSASVCPSVTSQILFSQRWGALHHLRGHGSHQYRKLWQWGASTIVRLRFYLCSYGQIPTLFFFSFPTILYIIQCFPLEMLPNLSYCTNAVLSLLSFKAIFYKALPLLENDSRGKDSEY